jgi:hypothetical protein
VTEEWRDIAGYEGFYQVSNLGRVRGLPKVWSTGKFGRLKINLGERVLNGSVNSWGYRSIQLSVSGYKKDFLVHRLVAESFIWKPCNKNTINHIDGDKLNNVVGNLEWVTQADNNAHALKTGLRKGKSVMCNETGEKFESVKEASKHLGILATSISAMIKGRYKQTGGYTFSLVKDR